MKIILLGYMGSGKTGVGKLLAEKLKVPFLDLDQEISRRENREIPEIFSISGEIYFRKKESEILRLLLENEIVDFVLSLGGGTPCYGKNLDLIKAEPKVYSVYLSTSLEELTRRLLREKDSRPLISHMPSEEALNDFIRKHLFERSFYYNQSDLKVLTDGRSMEEIAEEIKEQLSLMEA